MGPVDGHDGGQRLGQLGDHHVAVAEQRGVGDPVELVAHGLVQLGHPVAEGGDPQRRDGVEVAVAVDVDQLVALGPLHHHRCLVEEGRPIWVKPCHTTAASRLAQPAASVVIGGSSPAPIRAGPRPPGAPASRGRSSARCQGGFDLGALEGGEGERPPAAARPACRPWRPGSPAARPDPRRAPRAATAASRHRASACDAATAASASTTPGAAARARRGPTRPSPPPGVGVVQQGQQVDARRRRRPPRTPAGVRADRGPPAPASTSSSVASAEAGQGGQGGGADTRATGRPGGRRAARPRRPPHDRPGAACPAGGLRLPTELAARAPVTAGTGG